MRYDLGSRPHGEESLAYVMSLLEGSTRVLDVGCAAGRLGRSIAEDGVTVWGIEADPEAAEAARSTNAYEEVFLGDLEQLIEQNDVLPEAGFDAIVFADVLEHLREPRDILVGFQRFLQPGGVFIASIPNVAHASLRLSLLAGEWRYRDVGLLDATHLRFFTQEGIDRLFRSAGLSIEAWERVSLGIQETEIEIPASIPKETVAWVLDQPESTTYQFVVRARVSDAPSADAGSDTLKRAELGMLARQVTATRQELNETRSRVWEIEESIAWQIGSRLINAKSRLAPKGTRRASVVDEVLRGFKAWLRHGFRGAVRLAWRKYSWGPRLLVRRLRAPAVRGSVEPISIGSVEPLSVVLPHTSTVDIIIPVHNALEHAQRCLRSLVAVTKPPFRAIVIDDGSDHETQVWLKAFTNENEMELIRHDSATGYTISVNEGIRSSDSRFVVLLNSDTQVTEGWLDGLVAAAEGSDVGMAGPLSNTASWQSIPEYEKDGDWHPNPLPKGMDVDAYAQVLRRSSGRCYPEMPFLNGFCLLLRRQMLDEIGLFDEDAFAMGYGEENDLALRARKAGWRLRLADDVYVHHAQSRSFSDERRKVLSEKGMTTLVKRYGQGIIEEGVSYCKDDEVLRGIRARARVLPERAMTIEKGRSDFLGKRILFVLPIHSPGGGANVIFSEARAMQLMGVEVAFFNLSRNRERFLSAYGDVGFKVQFGSVADLELLAASFDAVIATANESARWVSATSGPVKGYYIQDYEPYFFPENSDGFNEAVASYTLDPQMVLFTKTGWNQKEVAAKTGVAPTVVGPSVGLDLFRPRPKTTDPGPVTITAMIRPASSNRQPELTFKLLEKFARRRKDVRVVAFGMDAVDARFMAPSAKSPFQTVGTLDQRRLAWLLNEADIFVDLSVWQAMGLTAMEAMACGSAVMVPQLGGASSFVSHMENGVMVDTSATGECEAALERLVTDASLRKRLSRSAINDVCEFFPEKAALNILRTLFDPGDGTGQSGGRSHRED